jgi:hypothetical protein
MIVKQLYGIDENDDLSLFRVTLERDWGGEFDEWEGPLVYASDIQEALALVIAHYKHCKLPYSWTIKKIEDLGYSVILLTENTSIGPAREE